MLKYIEYFYYIGAINSILNSSGNLICENDEFKSRYMIKNGLTVSTTIHPYYGRRQIQNFILTDISLVLLKGDRVLGQLFIQKNLCDELLNSLMDQDKIYLSKIRAVVNIGPSNAEKIYAYIGMRKNINHKDISAITEEGKKLCDWALRKSREETLRIFKEKFKVIK